MYVLPAGILARRKKPVLLGYKYVGTGDNLMNIFEHDEVDVLLTLVDRLLRLWSRVTAVD